MNTFRSRFRYLYRDLISGVRFRDGVRRARLDLLRYRAVGASRMRQLMLERLTLLNEEFGLDINWEELIGRSNSQRQTEYEKMLAEQYNLKGPEAAKLFEAAMANRTGLTRQTKKRARRS